jgi:uncharacterized protein YdeI (YjbR/CyaY-like superfamily)
MEKSVSAEEFVARHPKWHDLLVALRSILNSTELEETIKWSVPVYTLDGENVVGIAAFKNMRRFAEGESAFKFDPKLNAAFDSLAPYKQRE